MVNTQLSVAIEAAENAALTPLGLNTRITLLNSRNEPIASVEPLASTDGAGKFKVVSEISAADVVALVVDIRHEGFTSFSRRMPVEPAVYLQANLSPLELKQVMPSQTISISGATTDGFTVQVTDPVAGKPAMSISIPSSSLPTGTGSLSAAIKTYDPNNSEDAQYFPGSYADSTGNGLVSVAFNFADIRTSTGESLQALAQSARTAREAPGAIGFAAPAEPVIINRTIPDSSCAILEKLGDANAELAGFQIPVYTYNPRSGLWDLLGYGTVYTEAGAAIPGDVKDLDCAGTTYVLEIKVSNEIFLSEWWNLDYPLQFNQPIKRCANLLVTNENNEPLAGVHGLIFGNSDFASEYFVTDGNGKVNLELAVFNDTVGSAEFVIWDSTNTTGRFNLSNQCPASEQQTVVVKRPQLCTIKGTVRYENGKPIANLPVSAINQAGVLNEYWLAFGSTNLEGTYRLDVACNQNYNVDFYSGNDDVYKNVQVDSSVSGPELTDDGKQATLNPFVFTTLPYKTDIYVAGYEPETREGVLIFIGMYDAFPIAYDLQLKNTATGQLIVTTQGSLGIDNSLFEGDLSQWFIRAGQVKIPVVLPTDLTNVRIQGFYTDGFGIQTKVDRPVLDVPIDEI